MFIHLAIASMWLQGTRTLNHPQKYSAKSDSNTPARLAVCDTGFYRAASMQIARRSSP